ncbi:MAG: hypothetical protein ABIP51_23690 [Bacteroidia bacterium]
MKIISSLPKEAIVILFIALFIIVISLIISYAGEFNIFLTPAPYFFFIISLFCYAGQPE